MLHSACTLFFEHNFNLPPTRDFLQKIESLLTEELIRENELLRKKLDLINDFDQIKKIIYQMNEDIKRDPPKRMCTNGDWAKQLNGLLEDASSNKLELFEECNELNMKAFTKAYNSTSSPYMCQICYSYKNKYKTPSCGHVMCAECIEQVDRCPFCSKSFKRTVNVILM